MKFFVVLAALLVSALAEPISYHGLPFATTYQAVPGATSLTTYAAGVPIAVAPVTYTAPAVIAPVPVATKTQYHAQDELGQASYGHSEPGQAHAAIRDAAGNVRGSFAYVNPDGNEIRVDYTAGHGGYQVASNALPVGPLPVADTPEVTAAKSQHFQAVSEAQARNAAADAIDGGIHSRKKRGLASTYVAAPYYSYAPVTYASSYSYRYDAPKTIAYTAPVVKTIAYTAPVVKTVPVVRTVPVVKTVPVVRTVPVVKTYVAPVKTYVATAPVLKTYAPLKTYSYAPVYKTYAPSFYSYAPYYTGGYSYYG